VAVTVQIKDIVEALQMQFDETFTLLDLETGKVHTFMRDELNAAEESDEDAEDDPEDEEWNLVHRATFLDRMVRLPDKDEVNEWSIMEQFSEDVGDDDLREELLAAIHGKGAFRYFKDTVQRYDLEKDWYEFRDGALREIAVGWCDAHRIAWE
jgi:Uncharacterised protein family (UPF0158)